MTRMNIRPPSERGHQAGQGSRGEGSDFKELHVEHGGLDFGVHPYEEYENDHAADQASANQGTGPTHGVPAVGFDSVDDAGEQRHQTGREEGVTDPVDLGRGSHALLLEVDDAPDGADDSYRHRDEKDQAPIAGSQQAAQYETDER